MQTIEFAGIILYDDQSRILLQHRTDDAPTFPGYWSFFGGGLEPGETPEQAVRRETFEELAYRLDNPRLWLAQPFFNLGRAYTQYLFLERFDGSDLVLNEGQDMGWFEPSNTGHLLISAHSRQAIETLVPILSGSLA